MESMIRSGELRHRVEFQRPVRAKDSEGRTAETWETAKTSDLRSLKCVPARVVRKFGGESASDGSTYSSTSAEFMVRWFSGLSQVWRILADGRVYNIESFKTDNTGRRHYQIIASEGKNNG